MRPELSEQREPELRMKAAPALLAGLKTNEAALAELRSASQRPYSRYAVFYDLENPWAILLPHLARMKAACLRLQLRACAELAAGQSDKAFDDVNLMLYLTDSVKEEPFLISYLVRASCLQIAAQPLWEGLAEHRWSEAQLQQLQDRFRQLDFLADLQRPLAAERAAGVLTAQLLAIGKYSLNCLGGADESDPASPNDFEDFLGKIIPRGWYDREKLNYCALHRMELEGTFDPARKRVSPDQIESNRIELERALSGGRYKRFIHHRVVAALLLPALRNIAHRSAEAQTAANQAAIACALERHRLANGQFPEKLDALVPQFISQLPNDVLTGEPYKYRLTGGGQFVLYSVGWNEKDDGGTPGKSIFDDKQGDWVWQYPGEKASSSKSQAP